MAGIIYGMSSMKIAHFGRSVNKHGHHRQFLFLIGRYLRKTSLLKLLGQMEPNLAGSIYVRSSIKLLHLIPFGQQTWPLLLKIAGHVDLDMLHMFAV
jgi:hypothetical protein